MAAEVAEPKTILHEACGGGCGHLFDNPLENVHGMSGCPFSICSVCWENGVRFEPIMAKLGWVPARQGG